MSFKIVRSDITKMNTEAIVNTASKHVAYGSGCDSAVYKAAGEEALLKFRREHIGEAKEGDAFITPGFDLPAKYIIHAVSPLFKDGQSGEEEKLRSCYKKSLQLAKENGIKSIAFPLIATGSFGYPKEEGMRIAVDEVNAFLLKNDMDITLVVFGGAATDLGKKLYPKLEAYIDENYVEAAEAKEYSTSRRPRTVENAERYVGSVSVDGDYSVGAAPLKSSRGPRPGRLFEKTMAPCMAPDLNEEKEFDLEYERKLRERVKHLSDTFSEYLMYLIKEKNLTNAQVWKRAIVDKKNFSKIKNNKDYHPTKLTALCLCVGAKLNLDETKDLLARAGYALSPCDKTDLIFSFFIENEIYDMIELDIQLEEYGLPCIIK